jgi:tight adherence protein B
MAALALVAMLASLFLASPLNAQTSDAELEVLRVDLQNPTGVLTFRPAETPEIVQVDVTSDEQIIPAGTRPLGRSAVGIATVLIVDDSETADQVVGFSQVKEAALSYLNSLNANTRVMLVSGGGGNPEVEALVPFTTNHSEIRTAIEAMQPGGGSVMWNSISRSAGALMGQPDGIRSVVAVMASPGSSSTIPASVARGNLLNANAGLTVVAPGTENLQIGEFTGVADSVRGGLVIRADNNSTMADAGREAARLHEGTLVVEFDKRQIPNTASTLTVSLGGVSETVRFVPDGLAVGEGLRAPEIPTTSRLEILRGDRGAIIAVGLGVVATLLFSFAMMQIFAGNDNTLNNTLAVYGADEVTEEQRAADDAFASVRSRIVEQVVEKAESAAESRGSLATTTTMLQKAEIPLRVGEAMAVQVGIIMIAMVIGLLFTGSPLGALGFAVPAAILPSMFVKFKVKRRMAKLESQLPDTLNLLSSTLKAGYSFLQGIDAVGNEAEEPLAGEFRRTVNEARLGRDIDDALDDLAERVDSVDLLWAVVAIKIQREVGGNLAELLSTVANTMTARTRLRGEVAALTAEGKMSAYVLVALPILVGIAMYFMNPEYISNLWSNTYGFIAMGIGALGMVVGSVWMRKIIDIKI